jgi:hypothetical protein
MGSGPGLRSVQLKIGFSFGRCVRDIVQGQVKIDDVLCIIARTHMNDSQHVAAVIDQYLYTPGYLEGLDPDLCHAVGLELFSSGKVLEPRANGSRPLSVPRDYIWMDMFPTVPGVSSQAVQEAWDTYRMLITLTEHLPEGDYTPVHTRRVVSVTGPEHDTVDS